MIVYGHQQDPALDRMAKALSATGLDTKPKTESEWRDAGTWFPELKSKTMLAAFAEDDRFTARVHDVGAARTALFADGTRIPTLTLCFGGDWRAFVPKPYEVRVYAFHSAAIVIAGERLRLDPRLAPFSLAARTLETLVSAVSLLPPVTSTAHDLHAAELQKARHDIEAFEAALLKPFRAWWPAGAPRLLDRAIVTSENFDGSYVIDQLCSKLQSAFKDDIDSHLVPLSGCMMNDERRQEWLRSRGDDAWLIRGAMHVSLPLVRALTHAQWTALFGSVR